MKCLLVVTVFLLAPKLAHAQPIAIPRTIPMVVDLNKTAIGSWASYNIRIYPDEKYGWQMKSRWSLVGRDMNGVAVEMSVEDPGHSWNGEIGRFRSRYAFRGLSDAGFRLETTLMRLRGEYAALEHHLLRNFKKYAHRNVARGLRRLRPQDGAAAE